MNYEKKLRQLRLRQSIADWRPAILEHALQIVTERKLYDLSPSQVRALVAALEQVGDAAARLGALCTFFKKREERRGEEKRWLKEVGGKTRLKAVREEVDVLKTKAQEIVSMSGVPEEKKQQAEQVVLLQLLSYLTYYLTNWSEYKRRKHDAE